MRRFFLACLVAAGLFLGLDVGCRAADYGMRGVWVASVYNLDYPSGQGLSESRLRDEADAILENVAAWGLDTVFLQVRPSGDALYSSDIYPWSHWLSGTQGTPADGGFDPLGYFIERAHGLEIEVHAWINPYRITRESYDSREAALAALSAGHPALGLEEAVLFGSDGCLYFDPGRPESRALIVAGVQEILDGYTVDGIHLDDYFYPTCTYDDSATFALYGQGYRDIGDFRRASVTQLIQALGARVRGHSRYVDFGVSPFGIWANAGQHPEGSDTAGDSSYFSHYADTLGWVRDGLVDYIMPQLYWQIGSREADFDTLIDWWSDAVAGTGVRLCIGLAAYRVVEAEAGSVWFEAGEIAAQFERMEQTAVQGVGLYRYGSLAQSEAVAAFAAGYFEQPPERFVLPYRQPAGQLELLGPPGDIQVAAGKALDIHALAPLGATVHVVLEGVAATLEALPDGSLAGGVITAAGGETVRRAAAMAYVEQHGMVSAEILPIWAEIVRADKAVSLTQIYASELEDGGHRVDFITGGPVVHAVGKTGTAVTLELEPVAMAVLFEDDFFEAIDMAVADGVCTYTLLLPVGMADWTAETLWDEAGVALILRPPAGVGDGG